MIVATNAKTYVETVFKRENGKQVMLRVGYLGTFDDKFLVHAFTKEGRQRSWRPVLNTDCYIYRKQKDRNAYERDLILEHVKQSEINAAINAWLDARKQRPYLTPEPT